MGAAREVANHGRKSGPTPATPPRLLLIPRLRYPLPQRIFQKSSPPKIFSDLKIFYFFQISDLANTATSLLPPKVDIVQHDRDVRFVPKADSCTAVISFRCR